jgi:replicative DNA helicase
MVKADYFEFPSHQKFYSIIKDHYQAYRALPSDDQILEEAKGLKSDNELLADFRDELDALNSVDEKSIQNEEYYLDLVEEFAKEQALKDAIINSLDLLKSKKFGEIEAEFRTALTISRDVDLGSDYFTGIEERWNRINSSSLDVQYRTPFGTVNEQLEGGLCSKELAMVVAPPGVGKSLYLVNQRVQALMENKKVLYISLEMSEDKIAQRFDSVTTLIQQRNLKEKYHVVNERLQVFKGEFPESRLIIKEFPTGLATVNAVRSLMVQLKNYEDFVPDVILLDYLELMRPTREGLAEYQAQQRISEELRGLAVENNILVWTATQTNRQGRSVKLITDAELADAYGKIRTCDYAVSLNQTEEEFDDGRMRAYVMKSRNGKQRFVVPVNIDYSILRLTEGEDYFDDEE